MSSVVSTAMASLMQSLPHVTVLAVMTSLYTPAAGQSLPAPSRTIYKCTVNKVVSYSDKPCLGAKRLTVVPTRGVNKLSGTERIGADVQAEHWRESMAQALTPLTGMTPAQYDVHRRRHRLSSTAQAECRRLDPQLLETEAMESAADQSTKPSIERDLFILRTRYTKLGC